MSGDSKKVERTKIEEDAQDRIEELRRLYIAAAEYSHTENQRKKTSKELLKMALGANEIIASQARLAMQVISWSDDVLTVADGLAENDDQENLLEAVRLYQKGYSKNTNYSYLSPARERACAGLIIIALSSHEAAASEARKAMGLICWSDDALTVADGLVENDDKENLLEAVRLYQKGYSYNTTYSYLSPARKRACAGLIKIALSSNEAAASEARKAMGVICWSDDVLTVAGGLVENNNQENLLEAVRLYEKGYSYNTTYSYLSPARETVRDGLIKIARSSNEIAASEARKAMEVICWSDDALAVADGLTKNNLAKSDNQENLLEAVRLYQKGYSYNTTYSYLSPARERAYAGLIKIALSPNEKAANQARKAMGVICWSDDALTVADKLAKSDSHENLVEAVRLYQKGYSYNTTYGYLSPARERACAGLIKIALSSNEAAATQARKAMEVISWAEDALNIADELAKSDSHENLLAAIHIFKKGYYGKGNDYSGGLRKKAINGLKKIASLTSESKEADESLQKVVENAILTLGEIYLSEWKQSYPSYQSVKSYFALLAGIENSDSQKIDQLKEKLLTTLANDYLTSVVFDLYDSIKSKKDTKEDMLILKQLSKIVDKQVNLTHITKGKGVRDIGDLHHVVGDYEEAVKKYHQAAELNDIAAFLRLANAYYKGEGAEKSKEKADHYKATFETRTSEKLLASNKREDFWKGIHHLEKSASVSENVKITLPDSLFMIKNENILDFLMLEKNEKIGSIIKKDKRAIKAIDLWLQKYDTLLFIQQLPDVKREQLFFRILTEKHTGNQLVVEFCNKLEKALSRSSQYKKILSAFREQDKQFKKALQATPRSKEKKASAIFSRSAKVAPLFKDRDQQPGRVPEIELTTITRKQAQPETIIEQKPETIKEKKAEHTVKRRPTTYSTATPARSWKDAALNLFDTKTDRLVKKVKMKQHAINDSDPEVDQNRLRKKK
jgi:hypothetical protein